MSHETKFGLLVVLGLIVCVTLLLSQKESSSLFTQNVPLIAVKPTSSDRPGGGSLPPVNGFEGSHPHSPSEESENVPEAPGPLPGDLVDVGPAGDLPGDVPPGLRPPTSQPATGPSGAAGTIPPKPYVVRRGESLWTIARTVYGRSSPDVINYMVDANKDTIKDRDSLREGQTILIPPLPADMPNRPTVAAQGSKGRRTAPVGPPLARSRTIAQRIGKRPWR